jgi:AmmeMemoRadiSam system protein A
MNHNLYIKMITAKDAKLLIESARASIKGEKFSKKMPKSLNEVHGIFVTLMTYPSEELRGCIGYTQTELKLSEAVEKVAYSAAYEDTRFNPLGKDELENVTLEISILSKPEPCSLKQIEPGKDGVIINKGIFSALFLPQVWEQLPTKEAFFEALCQKAGLLPESWKGKDVVFLKFNVTAFKEKKPNGGIVKVEL